MKNCNFQKEIDVLMIYQDKEVVSSSIKQIQALDLKLHTLVFEQTEIQDIIELEPQVILLSSNNVVSTIKFYIEMLEHFGEELVTHSTILLINNKEAPRAYLSCEFGLFDDYVVINPMVEPHRLKLVLLKALNKIEKTNDDNLEELMESGEEELAACISHGVTLKNSFQDHIINCEESLVAATKENAVDDQSNEIMQRIVEMTFRELNQNMSEQIQSVIDNMVNAQSIQSTIKSKLSAQLPSFSPQNTLLSSDLSSLVSPIQEASAIVDDIPKIKVLIAEHSELFIQLLEEMFEDERFIFVIAKDGLEALLQYKEYQPDVILLSHDLAKVNGVEITKRIRSTGSKTPIVAYSSHSDKKLIRQWIPLGLSGYIVKPSTKNTIIESVLKAVNEPIEILKTDDQQKVDQIEWRKEFEIGNELIDEQHKVLFSLIHEFFNDTNKKSVQSVFDVIAEYIAIHFQSEEEILKEINYSGFNEHKKKHDALLKKFQAIHHKLVDYKPEDHHKVALFLYNWLSNHILKEDMDFKAYFKNA